MKRRIFIVLLTTIVLIAAFGLYHFAASIDLNFTNTDDGGHSSTDTSGNLAPDGSGRFAVTGVKYLNVPVSGKDGKLTSWYRANKITKNEDNSYSLTNLDFRFYQDNGQVVIIRAEEGNVIGEEVHGGVAPQQGTLSGNVRIYLDRKPGPEPIEDRPEHAIRIYVDDIVFDNDTLTIQTDGPVTVWSKEADIYGKGLFISWNMHPRELSMAIKCSFAR